MTPLQYKQFGTVKKIRGCIVEVTGLQNCINGQLIEFGPGTEGIVIGFTEDESGILLIKQKESPRTGDKATMTLKPFNTPVGDEFVGRVVNVLGEPLDNLGPINATNFAPIFPEVPSVLDRKAVESTVETGINIVDSIIPIGKGQRELILGDKMTGKTTLGTDIVLNQKGKDNICIFCCIGKSTAALDRLVSLFKSTGAFEYTIVIAALAGQNPGQQYLAPYVASSMGEYFMRNGRHSIVFFDDFTKHAWAYREVSLLMGRPPGRESYPGDVFYLHSQMIERAGQLSDDLGGGSMTFFPFVELLEGDVTGYIPTNLISMTDGQLILSLPLFNEGFKPAIDIGLSVSRIGSKAQWKAMKKVAGKLKLKYLQYQQKLQASKLQSGEQSAEFKEQMRDGEILEFMLVQDKDQPRPMVEQVIVFYGINKKLFLDLDDGQLEELRNTIYQYAKDNFPDLVEDLVREKDLTEDIEKKIDMLLERFLKKIRGQEEVSGQEDGSEETAVAEA